MDLEKAMQYIRQLDPRLQAGIAARIIDEQFHWVETSQGRDSFYAVYKDCYDVCHGGSVKGFKNETNN